MKTTLIVSLATNLLLLALLVHQPDKTSSQQTSAMVASKANRPSMLLPPSSPKPEAPPPVGLQSSSADRQSLSQSFPGLGALPFDKRETIARLLHGSEMAAQDIIDRANGYRTQADESAIAAIEAERDRAIRAQLSENEWLLYQENVTPAGRELHSQLDGIIVDDPNFSQLFKWRADYLDAVKQMRPEQQAHARDEMNATLAQAIEESLGTQARQQFERNTDPAFPNVKRFAQRFALSAQGAEFVYNQIKAMEQLNSEPLNLDQFPDGNDSQREQALSQIISTIQAAMPDDAFREFAITWLGQDVPPKP